MEPDREDRSAASAGLRDAGLSHAGSRDGGLSDAWRLRSLATGWLTADDWHSAAVDAVLAAALGQSSHGERPSPGDAVLAAVEDESLTAACAGLGRSRAKAGVGIAETIDDLAAPFAVLGDPRGRAALAGRACRPRPAHRAAPRAPRPAAAVRQAAPQRPGHVRHPDPHAPAAQAACRGAAPGGRTGLLTPPAPALQFEGDWTRRRRTIA